MTTTTATKKTKAATKPKAAKTKAAARGGREAGGEAPEPVPRDPGPIPAATKREGRTYPECDCEWEARTKERPISRGRRKELRAMRSRLMKLIEEMEGVWDW